MKQDPLGGRVHYDECMFIEIDHAVCECPKELQMPPVNDFVKKWVEEKYPTFKTFVRSKEAFQEDLSDFSAALAEKTMSEAIKYRSLDIKNLKQILQQFK